MTTHLSTPEAVELPDHLGRPDFPVAVRGYDRSQVDEYVGRLLEYLAETEARLADAEESLADVTKELGELRRDNEMLGERSGLPAPQSVAAFSERLSGILQAGIDAAEELRRAADHEARARREESIEECRRMLERSSTEAERILASAIEQHRAVEREIAELVGKRASALDVLGRLREQLGSVLSEPDQPDREDGVLSGTGDGESNGLWEPVGDSGHDDTQVIQILPRPAPGAGAASGPEGTDHAASSGATGDPTVVFDLVAAGFDAGDAGAGAAMPGTTGAAPGNRADDTRTLIARSSGNVPPRR